jgi:hypothetical protein
MSFLSSLFGMNAQEFEDSKSGGSENTATKRDLERMDAFYPVTFRRQIWIICEPHPGRKPAFDEAAAPSPGGGGRLLTTKNTQSSHPSPSSP